MLNSITHDARSRATPSSKSCGMLSCTGAQTARAHWELSASSMASTAWCGQKDQYKSPHGCKEAIRAKKSFAADGCCMQWMDAELMKLLMAMSTCDTLRQVGRKEPCKRVIIYATCSRTVFHILKKFRPANMRRGGQRDSAHLLGIISQADDATVVGALMSLLTNQDEIVRQRAAVRVWVGGRQERQAGMQAGRQSRMVFCVCALREEEEEEEEE